MEMLKLVFCQLPFNVALRKKVRRSRPLKLVVFNRGAAAPLGDLKSSEGAPGGARS